MTISNFKKMDRSASALQGFFDLGLDSGMTIYGMLLMRKGESLWPSFPGKPTVKDGQLVTTDGKIDYQRVIDIPDRARRDEFNSRVIAALKTAGHI